jgi:hypothetical protein
MERFERGLPDPQDIEYEVQNCAACGDDLQPGIQGWDCGGEICCSSDCAARYMGADEITVGE